MEEEKERYIKKRSLFYGFKERKTNRGGIYQLVIIKDLLRMERAIDELH
jgi:hypothetical protein